MSGHQVAQHDLVQPPGVSRDVAHRGTAVAASPRAVDLPLQQREQLEYGVVVAHAGGEAVLERFGDAASQLDVDEVRLGQEALGSATDELFDVVAQPGR